MSRATEDILDALHGAQAQTLLDLLKKMNAGEMDASPAIIAQVNKFLKDNGVDRPTKTGDPEDLLADELEEFKNVVGFGKN